MSTGPGLGMKKLASLICLLLFLCGGCSKPAPPTTTVFCAASLTTVANELWGGPADSLSLHSGGSHTLVTQYLAGAQAELLLLADASLEQRLPADKIAESSVFASNRLVLAAKQDGTAEAELLANSSAVLALADPKSAPLGVYSEQALKDIPIAARRVYLKDATSVLSTLDLGHADLAVVYASDLGHWSGLREVPGLDLSGHEPIRYLAVLLEGAGPEARQLYQDLTSERGQAALEATGFTAVATSAQ